MENNFYLCTRKVPVMSTIASRCTIKRRIWSLREISATFLLSFEKLFGDLALIRSVIWRDGGEGSRLAEEEGEGGFAVVATG